tara:strand:+ start:453 stop:554 length:102 start_codon:yes stop_codon:yes gene_type:complete
MKMSDYMDDFSWGRVLALGCIFLGTIFIVGLFL